MSYKNSLAVLLGLVVTSNIALANINANNGFYLGADLEGVGYSAPSGSAFKDALLPGELLVRPFIGYRFTDFLALEGGYSDIRHHSTEAHDGWGPDHYRLYSIDLEAKLIYPFANGLSLFGKAGGAYTHQSVYNQNFINDTAPAIDTNNNQIQPLLGVGISYNFTKNVAADFSYTNLFKTNNIGNIGMLGLGLSYTFGG